MGVHDVSSWTCREESLLISDRHRQVLSRRWEGSSQSEEASQQSLRGWSNGGLRQIEGVWGCGQWLRRRGVLEREDLDDSLRSDSDKWI